MWAEHHCVAPLEQWSIGNEAYFVALDDADDGARSRVRHADADGDGSRVVRDRRARRRSRDGFVQAGVVHGRIDVMGRTATELDRGAGDAVAAVARTAGHARRSTLPAWIAHTGLRAPFAVPGRRGRRLGAHPTGVACSRSRSSSLSVVVAVGGGACVGTTVDAATNQHDDRDQQRRPRGTEPARRARARSPNSDRRRTRPTRTRSASPMPSSSGSATSGTRGGRQRSRPSPSTARPVRSRLRCCASSCSSSVWRRVNSASSVTSSVEVRSCCP